MSIEEKHMIIDSDFVICKICEKKLEKIDNRHLKSHKITFDAYRKQFPNEPTMTKQKLEKELNGIEKRKESISKIKNKLKEVPCYFHPDRTIIVGVYEPKYGLCDECKSLKRMLPNQEKAITNMKKTIKERYGVDNVSKLDSVNEKRRIKDLQKTKEEKDAIVRKREQTMVETIGEDWSKINNEKSKRAMLEKYGVEHASQVPEFVEKANLTKSKRTDQEKLESNRKTKETKLEKHGDPNFNNVEKRRKTTFKKRGVKHHFQDPEVIKVRQENNLKKWGYKETLSVPIIREKIKQTNFINTGVFYPTQNPKTIDIRNKNSLEKLGVIHHMKLDSFKLEFSERELKKFTNGKFVELQKEYGVEFQDEIYLGAKFEHNFKCLKCQNIFKKTWFQIRSCGYKCEQCYPRRSGSSVPELLIKEFIESLGFDVILNSRKIISPNELDIYIPSEKIAFEYNGLYFHSFHYLKDIRKIKTPELYHFNKVVDCQKNGIKLIHIFEDEYLSNKKLIENKIKTILNKSNSKKIDIDVLKIKEVINLSEKENFIKEYHYENNISSIDIGAYNLDLSLLSLISFYEIEEGEWILNNICTNYNYSINQIEKYLFCYFILNYPWKKIIVYDDRRWIDKNILNELGFKKENDDIEIGCWFLKNGKRLNKFEFVFDEELDVIWDCGSEKLILKNEEKI